MGMLKRKKVSVLTMILLIFCLGDSSPANARVPRHPFTESQKMDIEKENEKFYTLKDITESEQEDEDINKIMRRYHECNKYYEERIEDVILDMRRSKKNQAKQLRQNHSQLYMKQADCLFQRDTAIELRLKELRKYRKREQCTIIIRDGKLYAKTEAETEFVPVAQDRSKLEDEGEQFLVSRKRVFYLKNGELRKCGELSAEQIQTLKEIMKIRNFIWAVKENHSVQNCASLRQKMGKISHSFFLENNKVVKQIIQTLKKHCGDKDASICYLSINDGDGELYAHFIDQKPQQIRIDSDSTYLVGFRLLSNSIFYRKQIQDQWARCATLTQSQRQQLNCLFMLNFNLDRMRKMLQDQKGKGVKITQQMMTWAINEKKRIPEALRTSSKYHQMLDLVTDIQSVAVAEGFQELDIEIKSGHATKSMCDKFLKLLQRAISSRSADSQVKFSGKIQLYNRWCIKQFSFTEGVSSGQGQQCDVKFVKNILTARIGKLLYQIVLLNHGDSQENNFQFKLVNWVVYKKGIAGWRRCLFLEPQIETQIWSNLENEMQNYEKTLQKNLFLTNDEVQLGRSLIETGLPQKPELIQYSQSRKVFLLIISRGELMLQIEEKLNKAYESLRNQLSASQLVSNVKKISKEIKNIIGNEAEYLYQNARAAFQRLRQKYDKIAQFAFADSPQPHKMLDLFVPQYPNKMFSMKQCGSLYIKTVQGWQKVETIEYKQCHTNQFYKLEEDICLREKGKDNWVFYHKLTPDDINQILNYLLRTIEEKIDELMEAKQHNKNLQDHCEYLQKIMISCTWLKKNKGNKRMRNYFIQIERVFTKQCADYIKANQSDSHS